MSFEIASVLQPRTRVDGSAQAQFLVNALRAQQKVFLHKTIARAEERVLAYRAVKFALAELRSAFTRLNERNDFPVLQAINTQPAAFAVSLQPGAIPGHPHSVEVLQLARAQISASASYAAPNTLLNNGQAFTLELRMGPDPFWADEQYIQVNNPTLTGMVEAINAADRGINASLVTSGDPAAPYRVLVTGGLGSSNSFTLKSSNNKVSFDQTLQTAADALIRVNGQVISRPINTVSNAVPGLSLTLHGPTVAPAQVQVHRDTTGVVDAFRAVVGSYNQLQGILSLLGELRNSVGAVQSPGGVLRTLSDQVRSLVEADSSTPAGPITGARDVGLSFDPSGSLLLDEDRLATALRDDFDRVVTMLTAGVLQQDPAGTGPAGLAGDAVRALDGMLRNSGVLETQTRAAEEQIRRSRSELAALEVRMSKLLERYSRQFTTIDPMIRARVAPQLAQREQVFELLNVYTRR